MAGGWIKLHRSALDTVETREPDAFRFWIWLLTNATHSETRVYRGKGGRPVDLQPGQLVISTANGCDGLSRKRTRSLIERFTNAGMIACETRRDTGHTITIVKWLEYQQEEHVGAIQGPRKGTYNGHTTAIQGPNKGQQHKNDKNDKKESRDSINGHDEGHEPLKNDLDDAFEDRFWPRYPRRVGKAAAKTKFVKKAQACGVEAILSGLERAVQEWEARGTDPEFIPHPTTWLNQGRWEDEPAQRAGPKRHMDAL
jgi:hypothetical protein